MVDMLLSVSQDLRTKHYLPYKCCGNVPETDHGIYRFTSNKLVPKALHDIERMKYFL